LIFPTPVQYAREGRNRMNISVKGEYALAALFDIAFEESDAPVKIADIARRQKIPQKFLELILATLKQGGFVVSRRGSEGGYLLARRPAAITVGEVIRFIEGRKNPKKRDRESPLAALWADMDAAISGVIDRTTIEDLANGWRERQNRYVPNWEI
jgi:Rrf2 family cysteine metabolism transcriptional repressor